MKGSKMDSDWRTVQLFISAQAAGVFEVEVDTETKRTRCNCPTWKKAALCKHTKFVSNKMLMNKGHYSIMVPDEISEQTVLDASKSPEKFREFVLKYAKIEVL